MDWILTIGIDKYNLTEKEKTDYLEAVSKGAKYAQIRGMILTTSFQTLVQKQTMEGKWECEYGKWHEKSAECVCGYEYRQLDNGTFEMIEKQKTDLINSKDAQVW